MRAKRSIVGGMVLVLLALSLAAQEGDDGEKKGFFKRLRSRQGPTPAEGNIVLVTTETVDRPYELVTAFPAVTMQEWGGASGVPPGGGLTDPGLTSVIRALEHLQSVAEKNGADAVIGVKIDFEGPVGSEEGRAIVYGTLIRFTDSAD